MGIKILDPRPNDIVPVILREPRLVVEVLAHVPNTELLWKSGAHRQEKAGMVGQCDGILHSLAAPCRQDAGRSLKEAQRFLCQSDFFVLRAFHTFFIRQVALACPGCEDLMERALLRPGKVQNCAGCNPSVVNFDASEDLSVCFIFTSSMSPVCSNKECAQQGPACLHAATCKEVEHESGTLWETDILQRALAVPFFKRLVQ